MGSSGGLSLLCGLQVAFEPAVWRHGWMGAMPPLSHQKHPLWGWITQFLRCRGGGGLGIGLVHGGQNDAVTLIGFPFALHAPNACLVFNANIPMVGGWQCVKFGQIFYLIS